MDYTTDTEVRKRYDWLTEDEFSSIRVGIAIYDATKYIDSKLMGSIPILPFTTVAQLAAYPIIETLCIQLAVCLLLREQNVRSRENKTKEQSYSFESATCDFVEDLIKSIQDGTATIGEVIDPDTGSEATSRGEFLIDTGLDVFNLHG
jgi:phage gp36-like protein